MTYDTGNKNPAPFQINFGARQKVDIVLGDAYMITVFGLFVNSLSYDCGGDNHQRSSEKENPPLSGREVLPGTVPPVALDHDTRPPMPLDADRHSTTPLGFAGTSH